MKKFILLLPVLVLFSCSIQKRKYQNGYYVDWKHSKNSQSDLSSAKQKTNKPLSTATAKTNTEIQVNTGDKPAAVANNHRLFSEAFIKKFSFQKAGEDSCDVIVFKDGSEIRSKVEEVGLNEIRYKRCDSPNGPMYVAKKSDIFMIKYMNGTKEVIKSSEPNVSSYSEQPINTYKKNTYKKQNHPLAAGALITSIISVLSAWFLALYAISGGSFDTATIFFLPFLTGLLAAALAIAALFRIGEQPDIYKGKGMAVPGLIIGLVIAFIFSMIIMGFIV